MFVMTNKKEKHRGPGGRRSVAIVGAFQTLGGAMLGAGNLGAGSWVAWGTLFAVTLVAAGGAEAQHLWKDRSPTRVFAFADTQAWTVGDLVTVRIRESTDVQNSDSRALTRSSQAGDTFDLATSLGGDLGSMSGSSGHTSELTNDRRFNGSSSYSVDRGFTDQVSVTVRQVLPNGNLVIYGTRRQRVAGEARQLVVSGVIRPSDILADNSIQSQYIGNLRICYAGAGEESTFTKQGWLARKFQRLLPF